MMFTVIECLNDASDPEPEPATAVFAGRGTAL